MATQNILYFIFIFKENASLAVHPVSIFLTLADILDVLQPESLLDEGHSDAVLVADVNDEVFVSWLLPKVFFVNNFFPQHFSSFTSPRISNRRHIFNSDN